MQAPHGQATEVWSKEFEADCARLPDSVRAQVIRRVREMGRRLDSFAHERLQGRPEFRLRVGAYRVIYTFEVNQNILTLLVIGHRREIYR